MRVVPATRISISFINYFLLIEESKLNFKEKILLHKIHINYYHYFSFLIFLCCLTCEIHFKKNIYIRIYIYV